jgi:hypothetical protein
MESTVEGGLIVDDIPGHPQWRIGGFFSRLFYSDPGILNEKSPKVGCIV